MLKQWLFYSYFIFLFFLAMTEVEPMMLVTLVLNVLTSAARIGRLCGNIARAGKRPLRKYRTNYLVNENCKKNNESYHRCNIGT